jgi:aminoglycoside phosphotransferase (APT) family kinase protein
MTSMTRATDTVRTCPAGHRYRKSSDCYTCPICDAARTGAETPKLHDGELSIDTALVAGLIAGQFPELAGLPLRPFRSTGTVNAIFRLGDALYVRLPRLPNGVQSLNREREWLPKLAPALSLPVPVPITAGRPTDTYPLTWSIYRWLPGNAYHDEAVDDEAQAAVDLARFVIELRRVDPAGAPRGGRRPLQELDSVTRRAIESSRSLIDAAAAADAWSRSLEAPPWPGNPVWVHADLLRPNLLVSGGRLCGILDFGSAGAGDPAADVIAAWSVFGSGGERHSATRSMSMTLPGAGRAVTPCIRPCSPCPTTPIRIRCSPGSRSAP